MNESRSMAGWVDGIKTFALSLFLLSGDPLLKHHFSIGIPKGRIRDRIGKGDRCWRLTDRYGECILRGDIQAGKYIVYRSECG